MVLKTVGELGVVVGREMILGDNRQKRYAKEDFCMHTKLRREERALRKSEVDISFHMRRCPLTSWRCSATSQRHALC